jgi:hypothetical protein
MPAGDHKRALLAGLDDDRVDTLREQLCRRAPRRTSVADRDVCELQPCRQRQRGGKACACTYLEGDGSNA